MNKVLQNIQAIENRIRSLEQEVQALKQLMQNAQNSGNKSIEWNNKNTPISYPIARQVPKQVIARKALEKIEGRYWMLETWGYIKQLKTSKETRIFSDKKAFATAFSSYAYEQYPKDIQAIFDPQNQLKEAQIKRQLRNAILKNEGVKNTQLSIPISWAKKPPKDRPHGETRICIYDEWTTWSVTQHALFRVMIAFLFSLIIIVITYYLTRNGA